MGDRPVPCGAYCLEGIRQVAPVQVQLKRQGGKLPLGGCFEIFFRLIKFGNSHLCKNVLCFSYNLGHL